MFPLLYFRYATSCQNGALKQVSSRYYQVVDAAIGTITLVREALGINSSAALTQRLLQKLLSPLPVSCFGFASFLSGLSALQSTAPGFDGEKERVTIFNVIVLLEKAMDLGPPPASLDRVSSGALSGLCFLAGSIVRCDNADGCRIYLQAYIRLALIFLMKLQHVNQMSALAEVWEVVRIRLQRVFLGFLRQAKGLYIEDIGDMAKHLQARALSAQLLMFMHDAFKGERTSCQTTPSSDFIFCP